jgi:hypothetical protein
MQNIVVSIALLLVPFMLTLIVGSCIDRRERRNGRDQGDRIEKYLHRTDWQ